MMTRRHGVVDGALILTLLVILIYFLFNRPPVPFYALALAPIVLAAVRFELAGGALFALVAILAVSADIALDPDKPRRAVALQTAWPILIMYVITGPIAGWLTSRERERLLSEEQRRARQLAAVREANREIAGALDLGRTLRLVMAKAAETLPLDAGALFQWDEAAGGYRVAASHNLSPAHVDRVTFAFDEGVPGWVLRRRQPLLIPDASRDARVHPDVVAAGVRSVLAIPLIARERPLGVLALYCKTTVDAFDDDACRLAQIFADQAAVFIENARLVDALRRAATTLEAHVADRTRQLREARAEATRAAADRAVAVDRRRQAQAALVTALQANQKRPPPDGEATVIPAREKRVLSVGDLCLDLHAHETRRDDALIALTPTEFRLLAVLAAHPGQVMDYVTLVKEALEHEAEPWEARELIKRHIFALRHKIEPAPAAPRYILNVRGVGYRLVDPASN